MTSFGLDHEIKIKGKTSAIFIDMRSIEELIARENHVEPKVKELGREKRSGPAKEGGIIGVKGFFLVPFKSCQSQWLESFNGQKLFGQDQVLSDRMIRVQ